jgi:RNA polymerase sigma factor (sigma-70 family)
MLTSPGVTPPPPPDGPLLTVQAFRAFYERVRPAARRWFARWNVPPSERDDALQEMFLRAHAKRDTYDPARGPWQAFAYVIAAGVARNHVRKLRNPSGHAAVASGEVPDMAGADPNPEDAADEGTMRVFLGRCLAKLDPLAAEILVAHVRDDVPIDALALAHDISHGKAYSTYNEARLAMRRMMDAENRRRGQLGLAALPGTLDEFIAQDTDDAPPSSLDRVWRRLTPRLAEDVARGRLGDDGTDLPGFTRLPPNPPGVVAETAGRVLRAVLRPRVLPALTGGLGAAAGAIVMYFVLAHTFAAREAAVRASAAEQVRFTETAARLRTAPRSPDLPPLGAAGEEPELCADAGARAAGATASTERSGIRDEARMFRQGVIAFQQRLYVDAITAFQDHARRFPGSEYAERREHLWALALIRAGRKAEARQRVERLRRSAPDSDLVKELTTALGDE